MVNLRDLKEVLEIPLDETSQDHYLLNLIRRATARLNSLCNRQLEFKEHIEYYSKAESNKLYLKNWPACEIMEMQRFNDRTNAYEDIINKEGDSIENSVFICKSMNRGLIRLLKEYSFISFGECNIKLKYKAGYKNILATGKVTGYERTSSVTGTETLFKNEITIGDRIVVENEEYRVAEAISNTSLTLTTNIESTFKDQNFRVTNVPGDLSEAVLILAASSYLIRKYESYGMDQKTINFLPLKENQIQDVINDSRFAIGIRSKFKDFDLTNVIDTYRKLNV